jgi:hypothetical protein
VFKISTSNSAIALGGLVWTGTQFFVDYTVLNKTSFVLQARGRFISSGGTLGTDLLIAGSSFATGPNNLATDGSSVLATYLSGSNLEDVKARLIHSDESMAAPTVVDASAAPSNHPLGVAFNSGSYLVAWNDRTGGDECDIFGRFVSTAGAAVGSRFTIEGNTGAQIATGVSAAGSEFFVTWLDLAADSSSSVAKGQFWSSAGTAHGSVKTLFTTNTTTGKIAAIPAPVVKGSSFLFLVNRALVGVDPQDFDSLNTWDLRGSFKTVTP